MTEGSLSVDAGEVEEDEEKGDAKNACVFTPEVECEGDGALVKEDMGRSEKMDESEEDEPLVLALLGSEEREREGVESAEEEAAAETAAEMVVILSGPASRREDSEKSWARWIARGSQLLQVKCLLSDCRFPRRQTRHNFELWNEVSVLWLVGHVIMLSVQLAESWTHSSFPFQPPER